jgi:flavodoxin
MHRILIVYYSRGGTTRKIATHVQKELGADIEEIIDKKYRKGIIGFITGGFDAKSGKLTRIAEPTRKPADYELVILATPVWAANITPAIRTYARTHLGAPKALAFVCNAGGEAGAQQGLAAMEKLLGKPVASLGLSAADRPEALAPKIKEFVAAVRSVCTTA